MSARLSAEPETAFAVGPVNSVGDRPEDEEARQETGVVAPRTEQEGPEPIPALDGGGLLISDLSLSLNASGMPTDPVSSRKDRNARIRLWGAAVAAVVILVGAWAWWSMGTGASTSLQAASATPTAVPESGVVVRGVVRPVEWSRVGTYGGGVVTTLGAESGDTVLNGQVIARVRSPMDGSIEVIAAPRTGTVTARSVSAGDSVMPGMTLFVVSDLSSLRVELADVDEFTVARVHRGQRASVAVPALDVHGVAAIVRSVGGQPVGASVPDAAMASMSDHYPVSVDLIEHVPGLRIGMAVRVRIEE